MTNDLQAAVENLKGQSTENQPVGSHIQATKITLTQEPGAQSSGAVPVLRAAFPFLRA